MADTRLVVLTVAAYLAVLSAAQGIGGGFLVATVELPPRADDIVAERWVSGAVATAVALALAIAYGVVNKAEAKRPEYWAVLCIVLVGSAYATYGAIPRPDSLRGRFVIYDRMATVRLASHLLAAAAGGGVFAAAKLGRL